MSIAATRAHRPTRTHTVTLTASVVLGVTLLAWYVLHHATPGKLVFTGIILTGMGIATTIVARRQRRILERLDGIDRLGDRLDRVDRQFAHVRMQYVAADPDE